MTKILAALLVAAIAFASIPLARSLDSPSSTPPGVSSKNWVAMGESAGFVMTGAANDLKDGLRSSPNVIRGYFMIRVRGDWVRADLTPGAEAQRL